MKAWIYLTDEMLNDDDDRPGIIMADSTENHYIARYDGNNDNLQIAKRTDGSFNGVTSTGVSLDEGWYQICLGCDYMGANDNVWAELLDINRDVIATRSTTDDDFGHDGLHPGLYIRMGPDNAHRYDMIELERI